MVKTIRVTKKHIQKGKACTHDKCPIALAIAEKTKLKVDVRYSGTYLYKKIPTILDSYFEPETIFKHNAKIKEFIYAYDLGKSVKGFSFKMDI